MDEFIELVEQRIRYFFNEEIEGWIDSREDENIKNDPISWCHGSSGIVLGRLLMERLYCDELFDQEYQIGKSNLLKKGLHANECVCHGSLGNMEILLSLSIKQLAKPKY